MARNIDIFIKNISSTTIQVCARVNADCGNWTFGNNPCQLANNFTTITNSEPGRISLTASTNDNICLALWRLGFSLPNETPVGTITLPITANTSGFKLQWSGGLLQLDKALCMTSVPGNTILQQVDFYYQNNTSSPILVCVNSITTCTDFTRGNNCAPNTRLINPGQLLGARLLPRRESCIASWIAPDALPSTAPPTDITTIRVDFSITAIFITVSAAGAFSTTIFYTCDPSTTPITLVNVHNCYEVDMTIQKLEDGVYVDQLTNSVKARDMNIIQIGLPQGTIIRLIDSDSIRISDDYTIGMAPGPETVFFTADGKNNPSACGTAPTLPIVTINNCNARFGTIEVFRTDTDIYAPLKGIPRIPGNGGSATVTLPDGTRIRLDYGPNNDPSSPFSIPNQETVNVSFLDDGTPSTDQMCPTAPPPVILVIINMFNCYTQNLFAQELKNNVWTNILDTVPPGGVPPPLVVDANSIGLAAINNGTQIRLVNDDMSIISAIFTVPNTTSISKVFFRTDGTASTTTCVLGGSLPPPPTGSSNITVNNCFDTSLNIQASPNGNTWTDVSGPSVSTDDSRTVVIQQGFKVRLANSDETTISGTFTVPTSSTSTVFFQSGGGVSTSSCEPERRTGLIIIIIVIVVVIIIIIIILIVVFSSGSKPKSSGELTSAELQSLEAAHI